jgi:hypothetical protein
MKRGATPFPSSDMAADSKLPRALAHPTEAELRARLSGAVEAVGLIARRAANAEFRAALQAKEIVFLRQQNDWLMDALAQAQGVGFDPGGPCACAGCQAEAGVPPELDGDADGAVQPGDAPPWAEEWDP